MSVFSSLWYQRVYPLWFWCCSLSRAGLVVSGRSPPCLHSHLCCVSHISAALAAVMITEPTRPDRPASSSPSSLPWREPLPHCSLSLSLLACLCVSLSLLSAVYRPSEKGQVLFLLSGREWAGTIPQLSVRLFLGVEGETWSFLSEFICDVMNAEHTFQSHRYIHRSITTTSWDLQAGKHLT